MTRRRNLERRRSSLAEIRDIMNSMKTLAYTETRKLARFLGAQHDVVNGIESVAADLLGFYPEVLVGERLSTPICLLIGSQRGFCGSFNHALLNHLDSAEPDIIARSPTLIAVGHKLCTLMEAHERDTVRLEGANVAEEVTAVLGRMVEELYTLLKKNHASSVYALYHNEEEEVVLQQLLPPFKDIVDAKPRFAYPPVLNQSPQAFLAGLTDQYLLAVLHEILYTSLMAENHRRVSHLEGAVKHLDEVSSDLIRKCNTLRQAEIIEEIEVILLNAANLEG